ncbi:phosphoheptose isomerase [Rhodohalobacter sp. 614A]|uniref:phosphoheptose isomerase n=1 Tax=Rhodohalobacter sp. 614A TaxID=2908649 RepID=UPI001F322EC8
MIDNSSLSVFINNFFPNTNFVTDDANLSYSPKILIVEPGKRLSWQYHHRRSEHWKIVEGSIGLIISNTNEQTPMVELFSGDKTSIALGQRHRLIGLYDWTVVAEIWQHQDPQNPSDENDIVRVEDNFGRENPG